MSQHNKELEKIFLDIMEMNNKTENLNNLVRELQSSQRIKLYSNPVELLNLLSEIKQHQTNYANPLTCITFQSNVPDNEMKVLADNIGLHQYYIPLCLQGQIKFTKEQETILNKFCLRWHILRNGPMN